MIPANDPNRKRLLAKIKAVTQELGELPDGDLDDLVHDCASEVASEVNNNGQEGQIEYLLRNGWKPQDIIGRVKQ